MLLGNTFTSDHQSAQHCFYESKKLGTIICGFITFALKILYAGHSKKYHNNHLAGLSEMGRAH